MKVLQIIMATILRPSWLAYRLTTSIRLAPRASLPLASRQAYAVGGVGEGAGRMCLTGL